MSEQSEEPRYEMLTDEEKKLHAALLEKIEQGGNDGADIYEYEVFAQQMNEKYGNFWDV